MGIIKDKKPADNANVATEEKKLPAFEGVEETGAGESETPASDSVQDVEHTEKKVERKQPEPEAKPLDEAKAPADEKPKQSDEDTAQASKSTAVLKRDEAGKLPTLFSSKKNTPSPLAELKGIFEANGVHVEYGMFPQLRVDAGLIATKEGEEAGNWLELQVLSYGPTWTVATGTDDEESKKWVRFSSDGKTINPIGDGDDFGGWTCEDYVKHLRDQGFEKASKKEYCIVYGMAVDAEQKDFKFMSEVVSLQLAPQSKGKFDSYVLSRTLRARMGKIVENNAHPVVRFTTERVKGKERSYFNILASDGKTAPADLG